MIVVDAPDATGELQLTTVLTREANLLLYLIGLAYPRAEVKPLQVHLAPDETFDDYLERTREMMRESQNVAKYVALDHLGYEVDLGGEGVIVLSVMPDSPSIDILEPEDVIVEARGQTTQVTDELLDVVGQHAPGDELPVVFYRDDERREAVLPLRASPDHPESAMIGINVVTKNPYYDFPIDIEIDAGHIGGPSAGLAFALAMIDRLTPDRPLVGEGKVACTGTVNLRGEVGPIGGVRLKAYAANRAGVELFLVPEQHAQEVAGLDLPLDIVPVATVAEAIDVLEQRARR